MSFRKARSMGYSADTRMYQDQLRRHYGSSILPLIGVYPLNDKLRKQPLRAPISQWISVRRFGYCR